MTEKKNSKTSTQKLLLRKMFETLTFSWKLKSTEREQSVSFKSKPKEK
jgi:hypothetical protein